MVSAYLKTEIEKHQKAVTEAEAANMERSDSKTAVASERTEKALLALQQRTEELERQQQQQQAAASAPQPEKDAAAASALGE